MASLFVSHLVTSNGGMSQMCYVVPTRKMVCCMLTAAASSMVSEPLTRKYLILSRRCCAVWDSHSPPPSMVACWMSCSWRTAGQRGMLQAAGWRGGNLINCYWADSVHETEVAWKEVMSAPTPLTRNISIQEAGRLPPLGQTLAARALPETLNSSVYETPAVALKATLPSLVIDPFTFLLMSRLPPLM